MPKIRKIVRAVFQKKTQVPNQLTIPALSSPPGGENGSDFMGPGDGVTGPKAWWARVQTINKFNYRNKVRGFEIDN